MTATARDVADRWVRLAALLFLLGTSLDLHAQGIDHASGQLLVRFKPDTSVVARKRSHATAIAVVRRHFRSLPDLELVGVAPGQTMDAAAEAYRQRPEVLYAEPNQRVHALGIPDDQGWPEQWNLNNLGQNGGQPDADVDAPEAWDITRGSRDVVVVVVDTGMDYRHDDLRPNLWSNPTDCDADGHDDDGNGWVDDCHGIDTINDDTDPLDDHGHGTHVAGTIGAAGDNGLGVTGVSQVVDLAACKFLDADGSGYLDGAIACLDWVAGLSERGINVVATNNSWGGGGYSQALADAIDALRQRGVLFVAAAGNDGNDNDEQPQYPASYAAPNVVAVAATNRHDERAWFSNVGRHSVQVAAPGEDILSTISGNGYDWMSGTSMAAPHVTGLAALLAAAEPSRSWVAIRNLILTSGDDLPSLVHTVSGKRINAQRALTCTDATLLERLVPATDQVQGQIGVAIRLAALHVRCAEPAGPVTVAAAPDGTSVALLDDGAGMDDVAGDGTYTGAWTPWTEGVHTLEFPDGDAVAVVVSGGGGYAVAETEFAWREITGEPLDLGDEESGHIRTSFPIRFGDATYDTVHVGDNGFLTFDGRFVSRSNQMLPVPGRATLVAPFWDDLVAVPGTDANVFVQIGGTGPHRELVIEWRDLWQYSCGPFTTVRFQVVFFEDRPDVLFQYADVAAGVACRMASGGSATVGIQTTAERATVYSFEGPVLRDQLTLRWSPVDARACLADAHCDDGVSCTRDRCAHGMCEHAPDDEQCASAGVCSRGGCDQTAGCIVVPVPACVPCEQDSDCDDGITCTIDRCDWQRGCETAADTCPPPGCSSIRDPNAFVHIGGRHGASRLRARVDVDLVKDFAGEPVTVTVRDASGAPMASQTVGSFLRRGRRYVFRSQRSGIRHLVIEPTASGRMRVAIEARKLFRHRPAGQELTGAMLELRLGESGCFRHPTTCAGRHTDSCRPVRSDTQPASGLRTADLMIAPGTTAGRTTRIHDHRTLVGEEGTIEMFDLCGICTRSNASGSCRGGAQQ